jgi:hypothetical protein
MLSQESLLLGASEETRHGCASRAPVKPEMTGFSRNAIRLDKRIANGCAALAI